MYAMGWWMPWLEMRRELDVPIPSTLAEARDFAVALGRKMMASVLRPDLAPIGFPLRLVTMTASDVSFEEFTQ
jgi:hypothetical protein